MSDVELRSLAPIYEDEHHKTYGSRLGAAVKDSRNKNITLTTEQTTTQGPPLYAVGMRKKSSRARRCPLCDEPSIKHGKAAKGQVRWRCKPCSYTFTATRSDTTARREKAQFVRFIDYVTGKLSKADLAVMEGCSRSTIARQLDWCFTVPTPSLEGTGEIYDQLFIDGMEIQDEWILLQGVNNVGHVVNWQWAASEKAAAYSALLEPLAPPVLVTSDGASGGRKALESLWGLRKVPSGKDAHKVEQDTNTETPRLLG